MDGLIGRFFVPKRPLLSHFFQAQNMFKKLTISTVLLTMFILTSNSANAGLLDWANKDSDNAHPLINDSSAWSFGKILGLGLSQEDTYPENTPDSTSSPQAEPTPIPAPAPKAKVTKTSPVATYIVMASAYSSTPHQTDDSPFITANGEHVYWGGVAANIIDTNGRNIPFGTKLMIPDLFGDQIFTINDRMNRRYKNNLDVWFPNTADAREFGRKTIKIIIVAKN